MLGKSNLVVHVYTAARLLCGGKNALSLAAACTDKHFRPAEFLPRGMCIRSQMCVLGIKPHDIRLHSSADFRRAGLLRSGDAPNFGSWSRLGQPRSSAAIGRHRDSIAAALPHVRRLFVLRKALKWQRFLFFHVIS